MTALSVNVADARGLSFECQPGCGFCCTATPLVLPHEAGGLGSLVTRAADGTLRIPIQGVSCGALKSDMMCGVYENRPSVCHLYPFQIHAGRRVQVTLTLGCPGVAQAAPGAADAATGADEAARLALAQPGAEESAKKARETFTEFDRRMKEWGVDETPDRLRAGYLPHLALLSRPERLSTYFSGLAAGDLVLGNKPAKAVEALFTAEPQHDLAELLVEAARDAFDEPDTVIWVEPEDHAWTTVRMNGERVMLTRQKDGVRRAPVILEPASVPTAWTPAASAVLARYLERLCHRDQTEASAAWLVDASGYQVTPAAAFGRVLGEAALQVVLRAGLFAAEADGDAVDESLAMRGVTAYETSYHSLPTLGSIL